MARAYGVSQGWVSRLVARCRAEAEAAFERPDTICWHLKHHHGITVSAATISRYLTRQALVVSEPRKRPKSSYLRFAAELPNQCWQSDFTHWRLAGGTHFICGHLVRLASRDDVAVHQQYIADIESSAREALASVNPVPY